MHELLELAFGYVRGVWRYRWIAIGLAWLIAIGGWIYNSQIPDVYKASARLYVDTNTMLRPLLSGLAIQPDHIQRVAMMSRMLLSRPNLEKLVRMTDLDVGVRTQREREKLLGELRGSIRIQGNRSNASLYSVSFTDRDPQTAKRVVQALVSVFIEEALVTDQESTTKAEDFIDQEIRDYELRLRQSEQRLADFKRQYAGMMPGSQGGYYEKLAGAKAALKDAELALREAIWRRDELKYQLETQNGLLETSFADFAPFERVNPRITALQSQLDELLLRYTERHPDVIEIRRRIEELERRDAARPDDGSEEASALAIPADTIYGSLRVAVTEADAQVAALKARVEDYANRAAQIEEKLDTIPSIEAELKQLNRDYSTISGQHSALLKRRESARLTKQIEKTTEGVQFRVIDPPYVPIRPAAPNRPRLATMVLIVAIGGGIGLALALDLLRPIYDDRRQLYRATGLPVFGVVTLVQSYAERRKSRVMLVPFAAACVALIVAYVLVAVDVDLVAKLSEAL